MDRGETTLADTTTRLYDAVTERLIDTRHHFEPLPGGDSPVSKVVRRKAFAELAMFVHVATAFDEPSVPSSLTGFTVDRVNDEAYYGQLARHPTRARLYAPPMAYAHARGALDDRPLSVLRRVLDRGDVWANELRPSDALDLVHVARLAGTTAPVDPDAATETAAQRHGLHPVTADLETVYRLTHELLFWYRLGLPGVEPMGTGLPAAGDDALRGLLLRFLAEDNLDIALELVIVGVFRDALSPSTVRLVVETAAEQATAGDGSLRGPDLDDDEGDDEESGLPPAARDWKRDYHTTFLGGVTAVVVDDRWASFRASPTHEPHDCDLSDLVALGDVVASLADYDLKGAATDLQELADTPVAWAFPDVVDAAAGFLASQRRPDGLFGHWADERAVFERRHPDGEFVAELVEPAAEECAAALAAVGYDTDER